MIRLDLQNSNFKELKGLPGQDNKIRVKKSTQCLREHTTDSVQSDPSSNQWQAELLTMSTTHHQEARPNLATKSIQSIDQAVEHSGSMILTTHQSPNTKQHMTGASHGLPRSERHPNQFLIWKARTAYLSPLIWQGSLHYHQKDQCLRLRKRLTW